nr:hypothetical protein [uncultured Oscillibacter sp.]
MEKQNKMGVMPVPKLVVILFFHRKWIFSMEEAPLSASPICARGTNAVS